MARLQETHEATIQQLNTQLTERLRQKDEQLRQKEAELQQKDAQLQQRNAEVIRLQGELQVSVCMYQEQPDPYVFGPCATPPPAHLCSTDSRGANQI